MLALDMSPHMTFDTPMVVIADAKPRGALGDRVLGACKVISNNGSEDWDSAAHMLDAVGLAKLYLEVYEKYGSTIYKKQGVILNISEPRFGKLQLHANSEGVYSYIPNEKFFGTDSVTALVELAGKKFKIIWTLRVVDSNSNGPECGRGSSLWKISSTGDGSWELQDNASVDTGNDTTAGAANSGFPFGPLSANHEGVRYSGLGSATADNPYTFNNISVTFASLEGQAVGNAMGVGPAAQITLDADAAGHGCSSTPRQQPTKNSSPPPTPWSGRRALALPPQARWTCSQCCCTNMVTPWVWSTAAQPQTS